MLHKIWYNGSNLFFEEKKNMEVLIKICYWMEKKYLSADVNDKYIGSDVFRSVL